MKNLTHKALWARCCSGQPLTVTGLEDILFTAAIPRVSLSFWEDAMQATEFGYDRNYLALLFCLFLAMKEEEIQEIVTHYKQRDWELRNRHYQVNP